MHIEFKDNYIYHNLKDIYIKDNKKTLKIFYDGNGDLYFDIFGERDINSKGICSATLCIKGSDKLYPNFEELVNDILNCNIFKLNDLECKYNQN